MAYPAHNWGYKEKIDHELLNNMEQGIAEAHEMAERAESAQELRTAFDMLASQTRAAIRELDRRLTALENS